MATPPDWLRKTFVPPRPMVVPLSWWQGTAQGLLWLYWYGSPNIGQDITPVFDGKFNLGKSEKRFKGVYAYYGDFEYQVSTDKLQALEANIDKDVTTNTVFAQLGYFDQNVYVQGKRVLKDYDPIQLYAFIEEAKQDINLIHYYLHEIDTTTKEIDNTLTNLYNEVVNIRTNDLSVIKYYLNLIEFYVQKLEKIEKEITLTRIYSQETSKWIKPASGIISFIKTVYITATPLYPDELDVKRIICRIPSNTTAVIYMGNETSQYFPLFAGEKIELQVQKPNKVYVRATEQVNIFCLFELV